ncbi:MULTISPECIES: hypothetical protein [unclassified Streptomyces]|uniref:hypothetical protein n=1 Tax=unclassified Streptomyces TaxID=2593676 RepID=UPI00331FB9D7
MSDSPGDGSCARVVARENTWAARPAAVRAAEGEPATLERIARDAAVEAIAALDGN